jgi:hypothetical protein
MKVGQGLAGSLEGAKVRCEGNPRELAFEIVGEFFPIPRMMQDAVDVVEDVPLGDFLVLAV